MMQLLNFVRSRIKEPSTHAGAGVLYLVIDRLMEPGTVEQLMAISPKAGLAAVVVLAVYAMFKGDRG